MNQAYVDTVRLLLAIAPSVFASQYFALKGGTALNLFVQDMPRLSVDIDVVFIDHTLERDAALEAISMALAQLQWRWHAFQGPRPGCMCKTLRWMRLLIWVCCAASICEVWWQGLNAG